MGSCWYIEQLKALGDQRRPALAQAQAALREVEALLPEALDAGLTLSEIADLSAVSRQTLHKHQRQSNQARESP
jgi:hypothetical protein